MLYFENDDMEVDENDNKILKTHYCLINKLSSLLSA